MLGSLEFGAAELPILLMMGLGHAKCGAVNATLEAGKNHAEASNEIAYLVDHIAPAIEHAADQPGDLRCNSIKANVALTVQNCTHCPFWPRLWHRDSG